MFDGSQNGRNPLHCLRLPEVCELTTMSRATIYREIRAERFPKQHQVSKRRTGWLLRDVEAWLNGNYVPRE